MNLDRNRLEALLPHRPPILMIEEAVDVIPRESGAGIREFKAGDPCFEGHFPDMPILPGVLVIESFAQSTMAVFLADQTEPPAGGTLGLLAKVNEMAFLNTIVPGNTVRFAITVDRHVGPFAFVSCEATEGDKKFASGKLTLKIGS